MQTGDFLSTGGNLYDEAIHRGQTTKLQGKSVGSLFSWDHLQGFFLSEGGGEGRVYTLPYLLAIRGDYLHWPQSFKVYLQGGGDVPGTPP